MSGHSKWATIKRKKALVDAKRGKAFTNLIKEITIAARTGGGDSGGNPRLRTLLEKAKDINMPTENISRAIKRGTGELPGTTYEAVTYEGYGPAGIAIMVDTLTDNRNRTVAELRHIFTSYGGNLAETGAVNWLFQRMGIVTVNAARTTEDQLLALLIDFNIVDIKQEDDVFTIITDTKEVDLVKTTLGNVGLTVESADIEWVATTPVTVAKEREQAILDLLEALENHDDVQNVYSNIT